MKKVGILGGTFNPIHMGHLLLAEYVKDELSLDEIWFMPTGKSYMKSKQDTLPSVERFHMVELAIEGNSDFFCNDTEMKRSGSTYTYETLYELKAKYSDHEFYFISGADCLFGIENWRHPELIFERCILVTAAREDVSMDEMIQKKEELSQKYHAKIILLPFMDIPISSTLVRSRIQMNKSIRYLVPEKVYNYIKEKGFYRE